VRTPPQPVFDEDLPAPFQSLLLCNRECIPVDKHLERPNVFRMEYIQGDCQLRPLSWTHRICDHLSPHHYARDKKAALRFAESSAKHRLKTKLGGAFGLFILAQVHFDRELWFDGDVLVRLNVIGPDKSIIISDLRQSSDWEDGQ